MLKKVDTNNTSTVKRTKLTKTDVHHLAIIMNEVCSGDGVTAVYKDGWNDAAVLQELKRRVPETKVKLPYAIKDRRQEIYGNIAPAKGGVMPDKFRALVEELRDELQELRKDLEELKLWAGDRPVAPFSFTSDE